MQSELKKLEKFKADKKVLSALEDVKDANKVIFAQHLKKVTRAGDRPAHTVRRASQTHARV